MIIERPTMKLGRKPPTRREQTQRMALRKAQAQSDARRSYIRNVMSRADASTQQRAPRITLPKLKFMETPDA